MKMLPPNVSCCDKKRGRNLRNPENKDHYFYCFSSLCLLEYLNVLWLFCFYINSYQLQQCVGDRPYNMQYLWNGMFLAHPTCAFYIYSVKHNTWHTGYLLKQVWLWWNLQSVMNLSAIPINCFFIIFSSFLKLCY